MGLRDGKTYQEWMKEKTSGRDFRLVPEEGAGISAGDGLELSWLFLDLTPEKTILGLRLRNLTLEYAMDFDLVKERIPEKSPLSLVGDGRKYYYPHWSSLEGTLFPQTEKEGEVHFPPFLPQTEVLELRLVGVRISQKRGARESFCLKIPIPPGFASRKLSGNRSWQDKLFGWFRPEK